MRIAALCLSACLVLNCPAQTAGAPEEAVNSLVERTCQANAPLLPGATLVKDGLVAMPDKCDERLFGTWYCGISCLYDDCEADRGVITLSRSIDPDGYERIHERYEDRGIKEIYEWKVERKWGTFASSDPLLKGKLAYTSCNGRTNDGYSRLAVNLRNPDGSNQRLILYWVDGANQKMWVESYEILWDKDKVYKKISTRDECRRDLKRYR